MAKTRERMDDVAIAKLNVEHHLLIADVEVTASAAELNAAAGAGAGANTPGAPLANQPMVLDASGNISMPDNSFLKPSYAVLAAAGTNQATAAVVADQKNIVTGADGTVGVALPAAAVGMSIVVINTNITSGLKVYPVNGGSAAINSLSANAAFVLGPGKMAEFIATSATQWYCEGVSAGALTLAQIDLASQGVAAGYKIARSATPLAFDGSNPTSAAHGLTTCLAAFAQLAGSAAPGASTSVISVVINGANLDFYAWKPTTGGASGNPTLIASTGTETFNWFAIGV